MLNVCSVIDEIPLIHVYMVASSVVLKAWKRNQLLVLHGSILGGYLSKYGTDKANYLDLQSLYYMYILYSIFYTADPTLLNGG